MTRVAARKAGAGRLFIALTVSLQVLVLAAAFAAPAQGEFHQHEQHAKGPRLCGWVHSSHAELRAAFRTEAAPHFQHLVFVLDPYDEKLPGESDVILTKQNVTHETIYLKARRGFEYFQSLEHGCDWVLKLDEDIKVNWPSLVDMLTYSTPVELPIYGGKMYYFHRDSFHKADGYFGVVDHKHATFAHGGLVYMNAQLFSTLAAFSSQDVYKTGEPEDVSIAVLIRDELDALVLLHDISGLVFGKYLNQQPPPTNYCRWMELHEPSHGDMFGPACRMPRDLIPSLGKWTASTRHHQARRLTVHEMISVFGHVVPPTGFQQQPSRVKELLQAFEHETGVSLAKLSVADTAFDASKRLYLPNGTYFDPPLSRSPAGHSVESFAIGIFSLFSSNYTADVLTTEHAQTQNVSGSASITQAEERVPDPSLVSPMSLSSTRSSVHRQRRHAGHAHHDHSRRRRHHHEQHNASNATVKAPNPLPRLPLGKTKPWQPGFGMHASDNHAWTTLLGLLSMTRAALVAVGPNIFDDLVGLSLFKLAAAVLYLPCDGTALAHAEARRRELQLATLAVDPRCARRLEGAVTTSVAFDSYGSDALAHLTAEPLGSILSDYGIYSGAETVLLVSIDDEEGLASILSWASALEVKPWLLVYGIQRNDVETHPSLHHLVSLYDGVHSVDGWQSYVLYSPVAFDAFSGPERVRN